jgi:CubicO group peptidase (beta-lactamase class C family)
MKRASLSTLVVLAALTCPPIQVARAQDEPPLLRQDHPVEREMTGQDIQALRVNLEAGQFLFATVEQQGIDVMLRVTRPDGEVVAEVDSPNGRWGPEPLVLYPEVSGEYRIELRPFDPEGADPGRYLASILRLERAATTPAGRVDQLFAPWDRPDAPGAAIAVIQNGEIVHQAGHGSAQLEYGVPITPSTIFHVASVSKQFTAFATAMLADQGKLSLDDDIRKHLPEMPDFGETITIRHLIHHTSGLRDQWNLLVIGGWRMDDVITRDQVLRVMSRQRELNFPPGEELLYCNTGYTLLAEIVARVSGQSFPEWTAEHLFEPLGMTSTHFHYDHQMVVPDRAYSYATDRQGGYRKAVLSYANVGATSLFTTVEDLAKWSNNLDDGRVGGERVIEQVLTRAVLNNGDTVGYAFGLGIGSYRGLPTVSHAGGDAGFRSVLTKFPEQDLAVAILSNDGAFNPSGMAQQVANIYLADEIAGAQVTQPAAESEEPSEEADEEASTPAVDPAVLEEYAGQYALPDGAILTITYEDGRLLAQVQGGPQVEIIHDSDATFRVVEPPVSITFLPDDNGRVPALTLTDGAEQARGERLAPFDPANVDLQQYAGAYYSPELETMYTLVVEGDSLVARHIRHEPATFTPDAPDRFTGSQFYLRQIMFERSEQGEITGLRVSNGRVRHLLFEKRGH